MKQKALLIIFSIILMSSLYGCKITPGEEIVINKGDGELEKLIQSTPVPAEQSMKIADWQETYTLNNLKCEIDADIILPQTNIFPVYKVKKRSFSAECVKSINNFFTAAATGMRPTSDTKEELELQLVQVKRGAYVVDDAGGRWEPYEGQEEDIEHLEQQIKNAPEEVFSPISDDQITLPATYTYSMLDKSRVYVNADERAIEVFTVKYGIVQLESWVEAGGAAPGEPVGTTIDNVKISNKDARETVNTFLLDQNIEDFGIAEMEKARIIDSLTGAIASEGWSISLTRSDGDSIPVCLDSSELSGLLYFGTKDYVERWPQEVITFFVDERGIKSFLWTHPLEVVEVLNSNINIMSFDEVKKTIKENIKFGMIQREAISNTTGRYQLKIDKIILSNVLVPIKDNLEYQMLIPVWLVFYKNEDSANNTVFAVNAIDGSSVDLLLRHGLTERESAPPR